MSAFLAQVLISASVMGVLLGRFFKTLVARDLPAFLGNILNVRASVAYQRETVVRENEERGRVTTKGERRQRPDFLGNILNVRTPVAFKRANVEREEMKRGGEILHVRTPVACQREIVEREGERGRRERKGRGLLP